MPPGWRTKTLGLRGPPARGVKPTPLQRERLALMVRCSHCCSYCSAPVHKWDFLARSERVHTSAGPPMGNQASDQP
jgi:hypothetical protein